MSEYQDSNCGAGMVYDTPDEKEIARLTRLLTASKQREAELQRENAELKRKLEAGWVKVCDSGLARAHEEIAELRKLLEESKVPEGWQLVPKEPTKTMVALGNKRYDLECGNPSAVELIYAEMLASAPQPKEPKQ